MLPSGVRADEICPGDNADDASSVLHDVIIKTTTKNLTTREAKLEKAGQEIAPQHASAAELTKQIFLGAARTIGTHLPKHRNSRMGVNFVRPFTVMPPEEEESVFRAGNGQDNTQGQLAKVLTEPVRLRGENRSACLFERLLTSDTDDALVNAFIELLELSDDDICTLKRDVLASISEHVGGAEVGGGAPFHSGENMPTFFIPGEDGDDMVATPLQAAANDNVIGDIYNAEDDEPGNHLLNFKDVMFHRVTGKPQNRNGTGNRARLRARLPSPVLSTWERSVYRFAKFGKGFPPLLGRDVEDTFLDAAERYETISKVDGHSNENIRYPIRCRIETLVELASQHIRRVERTIENLGITADGHHNTRPVFDLSDIEDPETDLSRVQPQKHIEMPTILDVLRSVSVRRNDMKDSVKNFQGSKLFQHTVEVNSK